MKNERNEKIWKRGALFFLLLIFTFSLASCASKPAAKKSDPFAFMDPVLEKTFDRLSTRLDAKSRIALSPPKSTDKGLSDYVFEELYVKFLDAGYDMPDRTFIDQARTEIFFGMTGEVDDATAASYGKFLGANVVVFGEITELGTDRQRLVYRALEVETGRMLVMSPERF